MSAVNIAGTGVGARTVVEIPPLQVKVAAVSVMVLTMQSNGSPT